MQLFGHGDPHVQVGQVLAIRGHGSEDDRLVAALAAVHRDVAVVADQREELAVGYDSVLVLCLTVSA